MTERKKKTACPTQSKTAVIPNKVDRRADPQGWAQSVLPYLGSFGFPEDWLITK